MSDGNKIKVSASPCLTEQEMTDYIGRKLSPEQRNRVEKHLLECDLCADAMEGLSMIANTDALDSLDELIGKSISAEAAPRKGKLLSMRFNYRVAAALALLAMAGGVLYFILSDKGNNEKILSQNLRSYKNADTIHAANSPATEATKAMNGSALKPEEKKTAATHAKTDSVHLADHNYVAKTVKAPSEQKRRDMKTTASIEQRRKDTTAINLNEVEVVGYKNPLIDKGNVTTQATVTQEEIEKATPATARRAGKSSPTAEKKAKSNKQISTESLKSTVSYNTPLVNVQKDSSFSMAVKAYNQKQYNEAVQLFDDYLKKHPRDEKATFYDDGSTPSADSPSKTLTESAPVLHNEKSEFYDDATWYKALSLIKLNRNKEAKRLLKKIKKSNSRHSDDAAKVLDEL